MSVATTASHTAVIRLQVRRLEDGKYLARSPDVPGLNARANTPAEAVELARELTVELIDFWREVGQELPPALRSEAGTAFELDAVVEVANV